jgi:hypothetical protein
MNLDLITLDDILGSIKKNNKTFDTEAIDAEYHEIFPEELKKYLIVKPFEVGTQIDKGTVIKYIKKSRNGDISISNAVTVVKKVYTEEDIYIKVGRVFDHFLVTPLYNKKPIWKLYGANQYIFKYSPYNGDRKVATCMRKIAEQDGKKVKNIRISPKTRHRLFQDMGMSDKEIDANTKLDKMIDELIETSTKNRVIYDDVNQDNLDDVLDKIMSQHNNKKK